jgi:signal transduction histidine kinase
MIMRTPDLTLEGLIHDLNNVFQTIAEGAEMLQTDPQWKKLGETLQRSVDRGQRLAHSIFETRHGPAELSSVAQSAGVFAQDYLEGMHAPRLRFVCDIEPGFKLRGDPAAWERVLVNLFLNAAEAGADAVHVRARDGVLTVSDNGPGIAEELLPRIFHPHVSTKSILSGLGLYIVQSVVEQYGGVVTAANRPEGGAEFVIRC